MIKRIKVAKTFKKIQERIDQFGNIIDPRTKQIITPNKDNKDK